MTLPSFQLSEPIVTAMVDLLSAGLNGTIDRLNGTITDGYTIDHVVQFLPYVPVPSTLESGMPAVGVQEIGSTFENDIVVSADSVLQYAVVAIVQNADQQSLAWQLRRTMQAIIATIQTDRLAAGANGTGGIMRNHGGAFSVNLARTEPGPLLADLDPTNPDAPPRAYLSWTALVLESMRAEVLSG